MGYGSIESKIVKLADTIAYINHDTDDAMRARIITQAELPPIVNRSARQDQLGSASTPSSPTSSSRTGTWPIRTLTLPPRTAARSS